jgi:predicted TIM-barrel fold metal-dependent hydrolase
MPVGVAVAIPNSRGTRAPSIDVPRGACDAHIHIYDPRYPFLVTGSPSAANASVAEYRQLQRRNGTQRAVVVQPRVYGTDNTATLRSIAELGAENARGVAVVSQDITDDELGALHAAGIRGIRFSLYTPVAAATDFGMVEPLAHRIHALGWHVQLHWQADQIVEHQALISRLPCMVVFDHLGRLPPAQGVAHPAFALIRRWLDQGTTWLKLSGAYLNTVDHVDYSDTVATGQAYVRAAPERLVWGSDWPHTTEPDQKPDDAQLLDLLGIWAPAREDRERILVDNPRALYGFASGVP